MEGLEGGHVWAFWMDGESLMGWKVAGQQSTRSLALGQQYNPCTVFRATSLGQLSWPATRASSLGQRHCCVAGGKRSPSAVGSGQLMCHIDVDIDIDIGQHLEIYVSS